ncbi:MAG: hypothetical protein PHW46_04750, partial [Candidatus Omnitrophica bacterium]|nr:hypothetical protein [Candidatus Omnitrophota bacterium]
MKIFYGYKNLADKLKDPVVAIGIFDGIHLGHKRVLSRVLGARNREKDKVIVTFDPHPASVLAGANKVPRIMSLDHRLHIFEKMGFDAAVVIKFTEALADMSPEEF